MKTYEHILDEIVGREYQRINQVAVNIHKIAAKEYAKQWASETSERLNVTPRWDACVNQIKQDIDEQ